MRRLSEFFAKITLVLFAAGLETFDFSRRPSLLDGPPRVGDRGDNDAGK
jgi:hypothetical protein